MSAIHEHDDYDLDDTCPNCGGEGYVSACFEEFACVDPDEGCDQCMRRCDWCNPRKPTVPPNEVEALRQVLSDALAKSRGRP